jgi:BirA family biotin operon repressor/biotin-[acetyl-CoA-carboxylase] ligase
MAHFGDPLVILSSVESTNNHAMKRLKGGKIAHGTTFFALEQTQGKGQRAKRWESKKGENITMSVVADCKNLQIQYQNQLSIAVALACYTMLKNYAGDEVAIKWPNDLYWGDRKAGGILIENVVLGQNWETAIIGIGINVNQTEFGVMDRKPVSLKQITGKQLNPIDLANEICHELEIIFSHIGNPSFNQFHEQYNTVLYKREQVVKFKEGNIQFDALVKRVTESGRLVIQQGVEREIALGEIEWMS